MECVCGYICEDWKGQLENNEEYAGKEIGAEEFIHIDGMFMVRNSSYWGGEHKVSLYACPKCNTIQLRD